MHRIGAILHGDTTRRSRGEVTNDRTTQECQVSSD